VRPEAFESVVDALHSAPFAKVRRLSLNDLLLRTFGSSSASHAANVVA
jgi:hypothetical protein